MPTTPIHALRYPSPTDPADGPVGFQNLAEDVEGKLGALPVTSLPGSPYDGQVVRFKVAANGPVWTLQYVAASAAPYRWHFLGGADLRDARTIRGDIITSTTYVDGAAPGPTVTLPLAGEYLLHMGSLLRHEAATGFGYASPKIGTAATADGDGMFFQAPIANGQAHVFAIRLVTVATAATVIKMQFRTGGGGGLHVDPSSTVTLPTHLHVRPQRVG